MTAVTVKKNFKTQEMLSLLDAETKKLETQTAQKLAALTRHQLTKLVYATPPSPKYQRTGNLMKAVKSTNSRVRINIHYAGYVHDGTRYMAGRPYLTNAISELGLWLTQEYQAKPAKAAKAPVSPWTGKRVSQRKGGK